MQLHPMCDNLKVLFPNRAQSVVNHVQKVVTEETAPRNASVIMEGHVIQQQANVIVVQATQEKGKKIYILEN